MHETEGFTQVLPEPTFPCCDLWPPGTLSAAKMAAYKQMMREREIVLREVTVFKGSGHITVEYVSCIPHDWILDRLRQAVRQEAET